MEVRFASPEMKGALRRIQERNWGFFIPPDFERQDVLLAFLDGQPVGSAYLNRLTHHIDFGVHVAREFQRKRVGTAILREALRLCRERGARLMFVTRVLRAITKINESDRVALRFYLDCGGSILREYRGFRRKKRPRPLEIPPLPSALVASPGKAAWRKSPPPKRERAQDGEIQAKRGREVRGTVAARGLRRAGQ